jgi:hypothetical protein
MPPLCEEKQKFRPFFFVATDPAREREREREREPVFLAAGEREEICRRGRGNLPETGGEI